MSSAPNRSHKLLACLAALMIGVGIVQFVVLGRSSESSDLSDPAVLFDPAGLPEPAGPGSPDADPGTGSGPSPGATDGGWRFPERPERISPFLAYAEVTETTAPESTTTSSTTEPSTTTSTTTTNNHLNNHRATSHRATSHRTTNHRATSHRATSDRATNHRTTNHRVWGVSKRGASTVRIPPVAARRSGHHLTWPAPMCARFGGE